MTYFSIILFVTSLILLYFSGRLYYKSHIKVKGGPFMSHGIPTIEQLKGISNEVLEDNQPFVSPYENRLKEELTFSDFGFDDKTVVFCYTKDIARKVLEIVDKYGHRHQGGQRANHFTEYWSEGISGTNCFCFGKRKSGIGRIDYCYLDWYQRNGYEIVDGRVFIKKHLK